MIGSVGGWVWTQTQDSVDQNGGKRKIDSYRKQGIQWQKTQRTKGKETHSWDNKCMPDKHGEETTENT